MRALDGAAEDERSASLPRAFRYVNGVASHSRCLPPNQLVAERSGVKA